MTGKGCLKEVEREAYFCFCTLSVYVQRVLWSYETCEMRYELTNKKQVVLMDWLGILRRGIWRGVRKG